MLNLNDKITLLKEYLVLKNGSYSDIIKDEIYFYIFENNANLNFLNVLYSKIDIEKKVDFIIQKIILHEHQDGVNNIINEFL